MPSMYAQTGWKLSETRTGTGARGGLLLVVLFKAVPCGFEASLVETLRPLFALSVPSVIIT
jgi:hypothetical protein